VTVEGAEDECFSDVAHDDLCPFAQTPTGHLKRNRSWAFLVILVLVFAVNGGQRKLAGLRDTALWYFPREVCLESVLAASKTTQEKDCTRPDAKP
jgi:hypothetical protein